MSFPTVLDFVRDGMRHRKWVLPARVYEGGIDAERLYYAVGDAPLAVSFTVHTGRYPPGHGPVRTPSGIDRSWHRLGNDNYGCLCLSSAACKSDGTTLGAMEWHEAQEKDDGGFVADETIFAYLREYYQQESRA